MAAAAPRAIAGSPMPLAPIGVWDPNSTAPYTISWSGMSRMVGGCCSGTRFASETLPLVGHPFLTANLSEALHTAAVHLSRQAAGADHGAAVGHRAIVHQRIRRSLTSTSTSANPATHVCVLPLRPKLSRATPSDRGRACRRPPSSCHVVEVVQHFVAVAFTAELDRLRACAND